MKMVVIKKDGNLQNYDSNKIISAVQKSAHRVNYEFNNKEQHKIIEYVEQQLGWMNKKKIPVVTMHQLVETALDRVKPEVAKSYRDYRNFKNEYATMMGEVVEESNRIMFLGDKENSNTDSKLVSTKRTLTLNALNKELYKKFFLNEDEIQAIKDGYIYIHDMSARRDTMNCFDRSTRFITDRGVKSFYDFKEGDMIRVLTHKGNWKPAIVHSYGWQKIYKLVFKRANGNIKEVYATRDHRWILKDGTETTNIQIGDSLIAAPDITNFSWDDLNNIEKNLWCLGFAMGDGSIVMNNNIPTMIVRLCGDKVRYASRFESLGYSVTYPDSLNGDGHIIMQDVHNKEIPFFLLNADNIVYYVNGFLCADGFRYKTSKTNEYRGIQQTGEICKYMEDLLNMAGYYISSEYDCTGQITNFGERSDITIRYKICANQATRTWKLIGIEPAILNPKAQVWCLDVQDDHSFILEGGIPTGNCCLFRLGEVLKGGFEMSNMWYNEPKTLDTAFDVAGDVILMSASQQYGGFTIPQVDFIMEPYAIKSYERYKEQYKAMGVPKESVEKFAIEATEKEIEQGYQGWEYKFNTVASSRGDYPFITITFGLNTSFWGKKISKIILHRHAKGQGKKGFEKATLFPKLVFLYDENIHGEGKEAEDVFEAGIYCSSKTMYPDWLSMSGEGYIADMYKQYKKVISPMGCRAFLSPYWEKGGQAKLDDTDVPVFEGRFNIGAISLHLPMILAKAREEEKDFYEVLDYYLEMIRDIHNRTYEYLGKMKASCNPLAYCEGGFYGGHLGMDDCIAPLLESATASFGITALNELQRLYNGKSIREDGEFALEVMRYINEKKNQYSKEDHHLFAIYGTPAESLCGKQVDQFRRKYGVIENVSDRDYVSNSFHCHVSEEMSPIEKQDKEYRFWELFNGGKIQYVKYPIRYNIKAIKTLVRRAMKMGLYEGVNLALSYCDDCGHEELNMDVCPVCGSKNLTKIDRMNGYLSFSRVKGESRLNDAKMAEIKDRKSM